LPRLTLYTVATTTSITMIVNISAKRPHDHSEYAELSRTQVEAGEGW
jgi:hypothetical protein